VRDRANTAEGAASEAGGQDRERSRPSGHGAVALVPAPANGVRSTPSLLTLQRSCGNAAVVQLLGRRGRAPVLQRHPLSADDKQKLKDELRELNGLEINALMNAMAGKDADTRAHYLELMGEVAGFTHEERLRVSINAGQHSRGSAASFALANQSDLTAVRYMDQIDAILRRVGAGKGLLKALQSGDKLATNLGGDGAIVRASTVRVRTGGALTWMAANPGAIGASPAFRPTGAYEGKTVGSAGLSIFPDDATGESGLLQWIKFNADRGLSVGGFFHAHAPTADDLIRRATKAGKTPDAAQIEVMKKATRGNDPEKYLEIVARALGLDANAVRNQPLSAVDAKAVATAIKERGEGWVVGRELSYDEAIADTALPEASRFRVLYTKWAGAS
jgi:hypothetical protein